MTAAHPITIGNALVAALKTAGFAEAELRPIAYTQREEVLSRKCVVLVSNADYDAGARKGFDSVFEFYIVLQKACGPSDLAVVSEMLLDVQNLVSLWDEDGALRFAKLGDAEYDGGPTHPTGSLFESGLIQDHQIFASIIAVNYGVYA